jgi:hypothetical protein
MAISLPEQLEALLNILTQMQTGEIGTYDDEQQAYIGIVKENAISLQSEKIMQLSMIGLSMKSHDLRQFLTSVVGYSALLNSAKLSDHSAISEQQLDAIRQIHTIARDIHWHLDSLILFANQIVRPRKDHEQERGMLNFGGYLQDQADHYVCRPFVTGTNIPDQLPYVYANHTYTKLMLRGLFALMLDLVDEPSIDVQAYTMMKFIRARVTLTGQAHHMARLMELARVQEVKEAARETQSLYMSVGKIQSLSLVELGLYTATRLASKQGGRLKIETDDSKLIFTLTMPTSVPEKALNRSHLA